MARVPTRFARIVTELERLYGRPKPLPPKSPLAWILWVNVAYLVDDVRREAAFRLLEERVGLTAEKIAKASTKVLGQVTVLGGMHPAERIARLRSIAELALEHGGGDLSQVLELEPRAAAKVLKKFPSIGEPGAEKILLHCGRVEVLALDSNGLRVVLRLGFGEERKSYAASYKSAREALAPELKQDAAWIARAAVVLRTHGKALCKHNGPDCDACPLTRDCRYYRENG